jgi:vacuolar-type H+-ATPase subunit E/Vma4
VFEDDCRRLNEAKQINLKELAKHDQAEAQAIRYQIQDAEQEVMERHEVLLSAARRIQNTALQRQTQKLESRMNHEQEKLNKQLPDLDKESLRNYLSKKGFSEQEMTGASDHRLIVMAEKARRYDEEQGKPGVRRKSLKTKTPNEPASVKKARQRFASSPSVGNAQALISAKKAAGYYD